MTARNGGPADPREIGPKSFDDYELTLGDVMRGERATLGKSLLDVQRDLKIKADYIAAIEDADLGGFESPGFIQGYVRSYARYLGMNPDWAFARFREESGFSHIEGLGGQVQTRKTPASLRRAAPERRHAGDAILARSPISAAPRPSPFQAIQPGAVGSLLVLVALVAGLGYGGWSVLQEIQRVTLAPVDTPMAGQPATETIGAAETAPAVDNTAPTVAALERLYRPQALDRPVLVPRDQPIAMLDPAAQGVFADRSDAPRLAAAPPPPEPAAEEVATAEATPQVTEPAPPEVVMFARRPAWVRVRAADGTVILEKIMEQGERFVLPASETPPTLRAGNSGSVFFAVNGETVGPAGPGTSVAKNVVLSASALTETYTSTDMTGDPELARIAEAAIAPTEPGPTDDPDE